MNMKHECIERKSKWCSRLKRFIFWMSFIMSFIVIFTICTFVICSVLSFVICHLSFCHLPFVICHFVICHLSFVICTISHLKRFKFWMSFIMSFIVIFTICTLTPRFDAATKMLHGLQPRTKYLREVLVFMGNSSLREKFDFHFQEVFH